MLQAWLLLPALLALVSLGCGLLVDRLSGTRLPGVLILPLGLATSMVVARACIALEATAGLATPVLAILALVGLAVGWRRVRGRAIDRWAATAAAAVFAVFAAPVVLSGSPTFAGYGVLGDTAVHFVLVDQIMDSGTDLDGVPPSSYRETLRAYFASGYPLGAHAALGAIRPLAGIDVAWAFQPFLAFIAALLALTLVALAAEAVRAPWRRAAIAALAAQPALVYGFALQGSVKELATLWLVPLLVVLVAVLAGAPDRRAASGGQERFLARDLMPLAVTSAAAVSVIGLAVLPWLGPILLVALVLVVRRRPRSAARVGALAAVFGATASLLSVPTLADLGSYLDVTRAVVTAQEELGNLLGPLDSLQMFGIWLEGDYRAGPEPKAGISNLDLTYVLIGVAAVAALLGIGLLVRRRALGPLLYVASSLIALWYVTRTGSPWADAKALVIASPAVVLAAAFGPVAVDELGARVSAAALAAALAAGVVVSNAMAYHSMSLAPHERLDELAHVGDLTEGGGATLYTEFEEFAKHFLRASQPVGASEGLRVEALSPELRGGGIPRFGFAVAVDRLALEDVSRFRTLVLRRSPLDARPPANFSRAWSGRYYEIWRRRDELDVRRHRALGPSVSGSCARIGRLARAAAGSDAMLVASARAPAAGFSTAAAALPATWSVRTDDPSVVQTVGPGAVGGRAFVPTTGRYEVWLAGSVGRRITVHVDGREVGSVADELSRPPGWLLIGTTTLRRGARRLQLVRGGGNLRPGNGDGFRFVGPLVLRLASGGGGLRSVAPPAWRELCERHPAWVELVAGPAAGGERAGGGAASRR